MITPSPYLQHTVDSTQPPQYRTHIPQLRQPTTPHYINKTLTPIAYFSFVIKIDLSHAVDVYHDWIDACEAVNASAKAAKAASQDRDRGSSRLRGAGADRDREGSSSRRSKPYDRYEDDD
jgi:hypothetical protein